MPERLLEKLRKEFVKKVMGIVETYRELKERKEAIEVLKTYMELSKPTIPPERIEEVKEEVIKITENYIKELSETNPGNIVAQYHKHIAILQQRIDKYLLENGFITNPNYQREKYGYKDDIFQLHELAAHHFDKYLKQRLEQE